MINHTPVTDLLSDERTLQLIEISDHEHDCAPGLLSACIQCTTPTQTTLLLAKKTERTSRLRNGLLRKVEQDIKKKFLPEHAQLIESLIVRLQTADAKGRQGIGYCLSKLIIDSPPEFQERAQSVFLSSQFIGIRRRGYKSVTYSTTPRIDLLKESWKRYHDPECAWLLVKLMPVDELMGVRKELLGHLSEGWQISRIYLRLSELTPSITTELQELDGICYSYVLAKLGRSITHKEATALVDQYETDERFGLLIWSFGQMGLWETLIWLKDRLASTSQTKHGSLLEAFEI
ncbi:hypothetical protein N5C60_17430 [Pseudomonas mosselii]|uniref:hypothetical protein n=1 Tax=Pseudomonas mosselii TaxID=78327 RepID=UPI00244A10CA|nr:hypothetical protein [Pseudomonas mosselii]MDH1146379.1 hypothetical protein [Pseudomonas mosselii]